MEAVPRMPCLSFELKQCPEYVDFGPVLKQYIREHYGEDPAHYNKSCSDLEQLRQSAVHVSHDFMGCSTLKKYYAQLQFLQGRFPMGEEGECGINFTWEDVFLGREVTIPDVKFEQACILYNIGALHSILGSIETRQSADGMKVACTHFQCAAWAFEYLRDHFGSSNLSVDMSHEVLSFQVNLMLAQAQECILEKSMIDSRKNTITAKVAAQVVEFYRGVIKSLQSENMDAILGSRKFKDWKKRTELKILFYEVITSYYMGRNSEEQEKFGECVAYYTLSFDKLKDCIKMAKSESSDIQESLRFTNDVVTGKYQSAKKDNDFVYHDKIPAADTLPEVKGASLVKGIPFNWNDPEVSGPDIFQKLVPMSAHEASSMYSEEKAKLLRHTGAEIEEKNVALMQFMSSLNLDPSKLNFEPERLPQDLLEKCAAVSVKPNAIKDLVEAMGAVSNSATEVKMAVEEINGLIENDIKEEEEFQKQFGKRSPNLMLAEMKKDCDRFEEGHKKGNQSNIDLHKAMNTHITNLKLLAGPLEDIKNYLPSLERDRDPESDAIVKELQRMLEKVEEMKKQRTMLENQFRDQVKNDDITNQIVAQDGGSNTMVMFGEQLKKHDKIIGVIRQNLEAQDKILRALTDVNAKYATTRRSTAETLTRREATIEGLKNSFDVYEDLLAKSQKGLDFYKKLESNVNRLLERCRGICKQQAEERQQIIDRLKPKEQPPVRPVNQKPVDSFKVPGLENTLGALPTDPTMGGYPSSPIGTLGLMPDLHSSLPGFEGPKLKDYLPFMKPKTFGKGRVGTGSLPSSVMSSPVHLPSGPESLPASPPHDLGMSDDDIRKLGITDPKVLAMIRAHSLPPSSGTSQQFPGNTSQHVGHYPSQQSSGGGAGQFISQPSSVAGSNQYYNYPSPSVSPSMQMGVSNAVRFDRSTKPTTNYQNPGPQGPLPSQPRMTNPSVGGQQTGYSLNRPAFSQPQSGYNPNFEQGQSGMNTNVSYSMPNASHVPPSQGGTHPNYTGGQSGITQNINYPLSSQSPQSHFSSTHVPAQPSQIPTNYQPPAQQSQIPSYPSPVQQSSYPTPAQQSQIPTSHSLPAQQSQIQTSYLLPTQTSQLSASYTSPAQQSHLPTSYPSPAPSPQAQHFPNQSLSSNSNYQPVQSIVGSVQQYGPGIMASPSVQQTGGQFVQPSQVSAGHPSNVGICPPGYGEALKDRMGQMSQTGTHVPPVSQLSGAPVQGQGQQNFSFQPAQIPQQVTGIDQARQPGQSQGQLFQQQPQMVQGHMSQNLPQVSLQAQLPQQQTGLSTQGSQLQSMDKSQMSVQSFPNQQTGHLYDQQQPRPPQPQTGHQSALKAQGQVFAQLQTHQLQQPNTGQQSLQYGQQSVTKQITGNQYYQQQGQSQGQNPQSLGPVKGQTTQVTSQGPVQNQQGQIYQGPGQNPQNMGPMTGQTTGLMPQGQVQQQQGQMYQSQGQNPQNMDPMTGPTTRLMPQGQVQQQQGQMYQSQGQNPQNMGPVTVQTTQLTPQGQVQQQGQIYQSQGQNPQNMGTITGQNTPVTPQGKIQQQQPPSQNQNLTGQPQQNAGQQYCQQWVGQQSFSQSQQLGQQSVGQPRLSQMPQPSDGQPFPQPSTSIGQNSVTLISQQSTQQPRQVGQIYDSKVQVQGQIPVPSSTGAWQNPPSQVKPNLQTQGSNQAFGFPQGQQGQQPPSLPTQVSQQPIIHPQFPQSPAPVGGYIQPPQGQHVTPLQPPVNTMTSPYIQPQRPVAGLAQTILQPSLTQTGTSHSGHSSTQQLNPLSPPDILPQPILPSPLKPVSEIQPPVQDVTPEVTKSKHDIHPRARESPTAQRKKPEKTHSRSNSNTSQPEFRLLQKQSSSSSIGSSLDDILSSSPTDSTIKPVDSVLTPKVLTAQEIAQQKEEALLKGTVGRQFSKDPYPDSTKMDKFIGETEKLAKFVESLSKATCSGPSHLDIAWKEIIEDHDIHGKKHSMAIGRCYPMKNRDQDVLPYDETRVLLNSHKDDYINASWINDLAESCPKFIATQAPLHSTLFDFWLMVYEQGSEVIVMLTSDVESQDTKKFPEYWPPEKGKSTHHGPITLTLQSVKDQQLWTERIIYLQHQQTKQGRTVVHLQFKNWPVSGFPEKVLSLLQFINEVHNFYRQQRSLLKPVMVHCSNGIGRTGTFLMVYTGMQEIAHGNGIVNIQAVAKKMLQQRRYVIREKSQLKFCYEAILYHAQDILAKQGILVHKASFGDKLPQPGGKSYHWTPTDDVVFGSYSLNDLKSNVERLGLNLDRPDQKKAEHSTQEVSTEEVEHVNRPLSPQKTEEQKINVKSYNSLPDVVQRTDTHRQEVESEHKLHETSKSSLSGSNASLLSIGSESEKIPRSPVQKIKSRDGSPIHKIKSRDGSPKPSSVHGSHEGSPKLQSLLDLQNPSTFSIGSDGGRKKITKASFLDKTSSLNDNLDPSDPFSSLDPMWTIKKDK